MRTFYKKFTISEMVTNTRGSIILLYYLEMKFRLKGFKFCCGQVTPFLLKRVDELSGGRSLTANIALIKHNAHVGAQIASALAAATPRAH
jgi:hypothetical protein